MMAPLFAIMVLIATITCGTHAMKPVFNHSKIAGYLDSVLVDEASGLAASRSMPGILYTHNDQGDSPRLFAINATNAKVVAVINISPANHSSWEDIAVAPCGDTAPGKSCIYILDDGPVAFSRSADVVYRVVEPDQLTTQMTLAPDAVLHYSWNEPGSDTLMVDPNGEAYVIGYVIGGRGMIVHLPKSAWNNTTPVAVSSRSFLPISSTSNDPIGGDIDPSGHNVLIRVHGAVYWWGVTNGDYLSDLLAPPQEIPHRLERAPGGICWSSDGTMFYTIGEGRHAPLISYHRAS